MRLHAWCRGGRIWICTCPLPTLPRERGRVGRRHLLGKVALKGVETVGPESLVMREPALHLLEWPGVKPARHDATALVAADEAGDLKHVEMLEHGGQRHGKRLSQGGDRKFRRLAKTGQHGASRGVGQRRKDAVKAIGSLIVNHKVNL